MSEQIVPSTPRPRSTRQLRAVEEVLSTVEDFVSAQELHRLVEDSGHKVSLATVYRILNTLTEHSGVDVIRTDEGENIYRRCADEAHHHHIVCRSCGRTAEIEAPEVEDFVEKAAAQHGFTQPRHKMEIFGLCTECADRTPSPRAQG